jgi:CDGSH-type Zn-finger protein
VDADFKPSIMPYPDGPYHVNDVTRFSDQHGLIRTDPMVTTVLCRCGASVRKPFCDGTHVKIGFSSARRERSVADGPDDRADRPADDTPRDTVSIFVAPDGPYVVTGGPELRNTTLKEGASRMRYSLCRCGASGNKPFCDGSHRRIGFKDDRN